MYHPLVSIIIPCYNSASYIAETIRSLLAQTYPYFELIIVNDGSTDKSEKVVKDFQDERIKYFRQVNKGQCAALNYGLSKSTGSLIKFYDADDILHPETIAGQVASLVSGGELDISYIEWRRFFNNIVPSSVDPTKPHTPHRDCTPLEYTTYSGTPPMYQCGLWLIPRILIERAGLWTEHLSLINDTEFFSRLFCHVEMLRFSDKGYTLYRTNPSAGSLSSDFSAKGIRSAIRSIDMTAQSYLSMEHSDRMRDLIAESYMLVLNWSYPKHKVYSHLLLKRIRSYTTKPIRMGRSGKIYNLIMKMFGWRFAKYLSWYYYKLRYNR